MRRKLGQYDLETGEVLEHLNLVAIAPKRRNGFGKSWIAMSQEANIALAKMRKQLGGDGYSVLHYLTGILDYENEVFVSKTDLAKELGMQRPNLCRAFKKVETLGFIREKRKVGNMRSYMLSPEVAWKGSGRNHVIALAAFRKPKEG